MKRFARLPRQIGSGWLRECPLPHLHRCINHDSVAPNGTPSSLDCPTAAASTPGTPTPPPPTYPDDPTSRHNSLVSFLQYAKDSGLNPESTVFVGTHYEYQVAESLSRYGFSLQRTGGRSDHGIDLLGTWDVPSAPSPRKVLLQCKATATRTSPQFIRELEGAFVGAPPGWRGPGVIALLVGQRGSTKGVLESMGRSRWPMGFVQCSRTGRVLQMLWNRRAVEQGLDGLGATLQYGMADDSREVALTFKGRPLPLAPFASAEDGAADPQALG